MSKPAPSQTSPNPPALRVRGRSFITLVLAPESPLKTWLETLDAQMKRSPAFFAERPVLADLAGLADKDPDAPKILAELKARGLTVIGIEGLTAESKLLSKGFWPPLLAGGKPLNNVELPPEEAPAPPPPPEPTALLINEPVRSGQSIVFPKGDVTIIGAVSSGAEVIAGGSIHVYGPLRGRAIAGLMGNPQARIFCRKMEAELLAIDGLYRTADDMEQALRGKPVQAWLQGDSMVLAALD